MTMVGLPGLRGRRKALGVITRRKKRRRTANLEGQNDVFNAHMRQRDTKTLEGVRLELRVIITRIYSKSAASRSIERRIDPQPGIEAYIVIIDDGHEATIEGQKNKKEGLD